MSKLLRKQVFDVRNNTRYRSCRSFNCAICYESMSTKVHYLNSHLHKFREKNKITIDVENIGDLAHYSNLYKEDKKTTKIFTKCFKNKESYKELLKKLPKNIERLGIYYLITTYWIAYTCHYHNDKFDKAMEECLESIDEYTVLLNSPHFCKKVYYYLNPIGGVK